MRLKKLTAVGVTISTILAVLSGVSLYSANNALEISLRQEQMAQNISRTVFDATVLAGDYAIFRSDRAIEQWRTAHAALIQMFDNPVLTGVFARQAIERLRRHNEEIGNRIARLVALIGDNALIPEQKRTVIDNLRSENLSISQQMASIAFALADEARERVSVSRWVLDVVAIVLTLVLLGFISVAWVVVVTRVVTPLEALRSGLATIGNGKLDHQIESFRNDEIGDVGASVNDMTRRLKETIVSRDRLAAAEAALRESEAQTRLLLDSTAEGIYGIDLAGKCTFANRACANLLGWDRPDDLHGCQMHAVCHHSRPDGSPFPSDECRIYQSCRNETSVHVDDEVFWRKNGAPMPVEYWSYPMHRNGTSVGAVVTFIDRTQRHRAEAEHMRILRALKRSNEELEQFAYVASHDLQEPLRAVSSYTQLLDRRYGDRLDDKAREYIGHAVAGAKRMQDLINDLLDYSRVTTRGEGMHAMETERALEKAMRNLETAITESDAVIQHETLPAVYGDEGQFVRVFQNLISNALKFRSAERPRIEISATSENGFATFTVRDNGIGIEEDYLERIFLIFQRLHTRKEYPGSGLGLAITKRIVERHGGEIWLESVPGRGSAFHFTIPTGPREDMT